jgi:hypothetical protein
LLEIDWQESVALMKQPIIVDANGFLRAKLSENPEVIYRTVGAPRTL